MVTPKTRNTKIPNFEILKSKIPNMATPLYKRSLCKRNKKLNSGEGTSTFPFVQDSSIHHVRLN
jgi:hypothetical protein